MLEKQLQEEILILRKKLEEKEDELSQLISEKQNVQSNGLNNSEIARYSRQMLLPEIAVAGI